MLRRFLLLFVFIPVIVYANQSLENDLKLANDEEYSRITSGVQDILMVKE